jgi:hypothetical protein
MEVDHFSNSYNLAKVHSSRSRAEVEENVRLEEEGDNSDMSMPLSRFPSLTYARLIRSRS